MRDGGLSQGDRRNRKDASAFQRCPSDFPRPQANPPGRTGKHDRWAAVFPGTSLNSWRSCTALAVCRKDFLNGCARGAGPHRNGEAESGTPRRALGDRGERTRVAGPLVKSSWDRGVSSGATGQSAGGRRFSESGLCEPCWTQG